MTSAGGKRKSWLRWLVGVALLLVGAILFVQYFWLTRTMGSGPAGPPVPREPFARVWTQRPVLLVGLGDSVTAGYGASPGLSYFDRLAQNPPGEFPEMRGVCLKAVLPNLRAENHAVSGSTSLDHAEHEIPALRAAPPDTLGIVVITTGGNDLIHNYGRTPPREGAMYGATLAQAQPWIENFGRRLERMRELLRSKFPGSCEIFLADIYDPTDGDGTAGVVGLPSWRGGLAIHARYNALLERLAARYPDVHRVDIRSTMLGHGIYCRQFWRRHYQPHDAHYWYNENFEDPNDRGYDAIRRAFLREIANYRDRFTP